MNSALDALLSRTMQEVLALLLLHPDRSYYQREIAEETGMNLRGVQDTLARLVASGIISRTERGRQVFYRARQDCPIMEELTRILVKTMGVRDKLQEALQPLEEKINVAVIFGSWARGDQQPDSDIDLFIVGDISLHEVSKALRAPAAELGREINPVVMSREELQTRLDEGEHFATRIAGSDTITVIGDANELKEMA